MSKIQIKSEALEGRRRSAFDQRQIEAASEVPTHQLNVAVKVPLLERLRAASTWEGKTIVEIVDEALAEKLDALESGRGEPYEVLAAHRVSKRKR